MKPSVNFNQVKEDMLKDDEFRMEYDKLKPRYNRYTYSIKARQEQHITQEELAKRVGTQKSNISRFESGNYNPSLDFLTKIAESLGKNVSIKLV